MRLTTYHYKHDKILDAHEPFSGAAKTQGAARHYKGLTAVADAFIRSLQVNANH